MELLKSKEDISVGNTKSIIDKVEESNIKTSNFKRPALSSIGVFPTGNRVIVRNVFEIPASLVTKTEHIFKSTPVSTQIVAYGCETEEIEIGDEVLISYHTSVERLIIPNNKRSVTEVQKRVVDRIKGNFAELSKMNVQMEEFYITPYFSVSCIVKKEGVKNEMIWYDAEIGNV